MSKTHNCTLPKPDKLGRYRPVIGKTQHGKPQRFQVGNARDTTQAEAQRRIDYLRQFYVIQCKEEHCDYWAGWCLGWAYRIAKEGQVKVYGSGCNARGQAAEEMAIIHRLQSWGLPISVADYDLQQRGNGYLREVVEREVSRAIETAVSKLDKTFGKEFVQSVKTEIIPSNILDAETKTLYEALAEYEKSLKGINAYKQIRQNKYLKQVNSDIQLWRLDLPQITSMVDYWRNRPITRKGNRCKKNHSTNMIKGIFHFLKWLDTSPLFKWEKPKGFENINRSPISLPEDNNGEAFQTITKNTYTPQQLATIVSHADDYGKAIIGICVNCGFGASEIGQLSTKGYSLYKAHSHADKLGIVSTDEDSWIVGNRPKSNVYGEHLLWSEVAKAIQPFLDGREVFTITSSGKPWYRPHAKNAQTAFSNWWYGLIDRVVKSNPDFPRLPFGSLRDTFPNILRQQYSNDIADMALQHGDPKEHNLLKCYTNTPFGKLFSATKELAEMFKPFLDALAQT